MKKLLSAVPADGSSYWCCLLCPTRSLPPTLIRLPSLRTGPFTVITPNKRYAQRWQQGWSRRQIVSAAENANNSDLTGMDVDQAGERADALIDAARYADCPGLNAS